MTTPMSTPRPPTSPAVGSMGRWADDPGVDRQRGRFPTIDFLLFAMLAMPAVAVAGLPLSELAMGVAVLVGVTRRARAPLTLGLVGPLVGLVGLMFLSGALNAITAERRLLHLGLYVALAFFLAQGRYSRLAVSWGLVAGLYLSAGAWFVGFGVDYPGRLGGLMSDPNAAGYTITVLGCLALAGLPSRRWRIVVGLPLVVAVVLTDSRTAMLAMLLVAVWVLVVGRRFGPGWGIAVLAAMMYAVARIPAGLEAYGHFAERAGSDALRRRIVAEERIQIADMPWYGNGPGTSHVEVLGQTFFFHNSYLGLINEAGWIALVLLLLAGAIALVNLLRLPRASRNPWYDGALVAAVVCALNLGEVLLELPTAVALGMATWWATESRERASAASRPPPVITSDPGSPPVPGPGPVEAA